MSALVEDKTRALLTSGHVRVRQVDERAILVEVDGYTASYRVTWTVQRGWHCSCPEMRGRCSHLRAARRITVATEAGERPSMPPASTLEGAP